MCAVFVKERANNMSKVTNKMEVKLAQNLLEQQLSKLKGILLTGGGKDEVFAIGAQLLYIGQALTEASGFKLEPATIEGRALVSKIVAFLEMHTINPEIIGQTITEPSEYFNEGTPHNSMQVPGTMTEKEAVIYNQGA